MPVNQTPQLNSNLENQMHKSGTFCYRKMVSFTTICNHSCISQHTKITKGKRPNNDIEFAKEG